MTLTNLELGSAHIEPDDPIIAGSCGEWTITYTVGEYGMDEGSTLKLAQRYASDWQVPQFDDPAGEAYMTVRTDGPAMLRVRYDTKGYIRPYMKCVVVDVYDGSLRPGDHIILVLGDRSGGGPGVRAQTFCESAHEFQVFVDPTNSCKVIPLPNSPTLPVVAGPPRALRVTLPTQATVGQSVDVHIRGVDSWDNLTAPPENVQLEWKGEGLVQINGTTLTLQEPGQGHVVAKASKRQSCSNPMTIDTDSPTHQKYWGDLHAQTATTIGTGSDQEYFSFGRNQAALDVIGHQGNDFQISDTYWQQLQKTIRQYNEEGRYVVLPGYEWSATTYAGGDRNVYFRQDDAPIMRSSHWLIPDTPHNELSPACPADVLFKRLREEVGLDNVVLAAHVGGRYANLPEYFDEQLGPLVEVMSCWGIFEWMLWDAFEAGYLIGVVANSDGHKGRPGAEGPGAGEFGLAGGLTCILAESLTRDAIIDALQARRCYATTGARIDLNFSIDNQPMGSVLKSDTPVTLRGSVIGSGPLDVLLLYRGRDILQEIRPAEFDHLQDSPRIRVTWGGSRIRGRGRRVNWSGTIRVEGTTIREATEVAFDCQADGITEKDAHHVSFHSQTTGDMDGVILWLADPQAGRVFFDSPVLSGEISLDELGDYPVRFDAGGVDMNIRFQRYPTAPCTTRLSLEATVEPETLKQPYFIKAIQCDGEMAWSSPVYLEKL